MTEYEPPHRTQRRPLPDPQPILRAAHQARLSWLEAMAKVSGDGLSEQDRIEKQDELDNLEDEEYK